MINDRIVPGDMVTLSNHTYKVYGSRDLQVIDDTSIGIVICIERVDEEPVLRLCGQALVWFPEGMLQLNSVHLNLIES